MYDYVDYYGQYISIVGRVNEAASNALSHSVSNNICNQLDNSINNMNSLNSALSSENRDSAVIGFTNTITNQLSIINNIQDFLRGDYVSVERVYQDLKNNLETLKIMDDKLKKLCNAKPDKNKYYESQYDSTTESYNSILNEKKYNKAINNWHIKVLSLKGDCKDLKTRIDEYLSYLDAISCSIPSDGKTSIKVPSSGIPPLRFNALSKLFDLEDTVSESTKPENIKFHTYKYQTSKGPTTVYYSIIPRSLRPNLAIATNSKGNIDKKLPWKFADEVGAKLAINFSLFGGGRNEPGKRDGGAGISYDGEHLFIGKHYNCDTTLYMDENGNFGYIDNTSFKSIDDVAPTLKEKNVQWAAKGFYPIIDEYEYVNKNTDNNIGSDSIRHPRTFIGQLDNGDYIMGVCSGRNKNDDGEYEHGMTLKEVGDFVQNYAIDDEGNKIHVRFLMNGDGGGSSAFVVDGEKKNVSGEDRATTDIIYIGGVKV